MTRLIVTAHAERDLETILEYLTAVAGEQTSTTYAGRFADTLERITQFPGSGPRRPALGSDTRIALVLPYIFIYDFSTDLDQVVLLRTLHGRQSITDHLLQR